MILSFRPSFLISARIPRSGESIGGQAGIGSEVYRFPHTRSKCRCMTRSAKLLAWVVMLIVFFFCAPAFSTELISKRSVIDSYGGCTWRDNSDGTATASLIINFKAATNEGGRFMSRTLMTVTFGNNGQRVNESRDESLNGVPMNRGVLPPNTDLEWMDLRVPGGIPDNGWHNPNAFTANVEIRLGNRTRAATVTAGNWNDLGANVSLYTLEQTGAAYLYPGTDGSGCQTVPPVDPPKPPLTIHMSAPDWDLGELTADYGEKRYTDAADQLCFTYSGLSSDVADVVVDADSENGTVANQYRLKSLADPTQIVPYSVMLNDGTTEFTLPNQNKSEIKLNASGRTCLAPTFRTYVKPGLKKGDYTDVLTFTVTTKT
ncbi:hypothetical protein [Burkholderia plantarii]|uniref:hypothetical protein n=1 Tax=Burkholderia plantarii TaxID=41899 RepID=UPI000F508C3E|nr:hypothetical protein [Burkholderia plantarii]